MNRLLSHSLCVSIVLLGVATLAIGQNATSPGRPTASAPGSTADSGTAAEREQIWNSPTMLRARAWVQEYCARSAKITPAQAKAYMTELENLSPTQMKLWLLKFEHEEDTIRQQQADFNRSRQAGLNQALVMRRDTQQAYNDINQGVTEAAEGAQRSINEQNALAASRETDKEMMDSVEAGNTQGYNDPYGGYGYYANGFYPLSPYPAAPVHVHVYR